MPIKRRIVNGAKVWVIDRTFRAPGKPPLRYRKAAQVQNREAAEAEERRLCDHWTKFGTLEVQPTLELRQEAPKTWEEAVTHFEETALPLLKPSTRRGYRALLDGPGIKFWEGKPLTPETIGVNAQKKWLASLATMGESTRRNYQILFRSVIRACGPTFDPRTGSTEPGEILQELPQFIKLTKVGRKESQPVDPRDVALILGEGKARYVQARNQQKFKVAFALAAFAGLRSGEIRALKKRDVDLEAGVLYVRFARAAGEETTPKSSHQRRIPIPKKLRGFLEPAVNALKSPDSHVCTNSKGLPWGDIGLSVCFKRTCERLGIQGARLHGLRHFFTSSLFGAGVDAKTVQELLGHQDLTTTQIYAHSTKERQKKAVEDAFDGDPLMKIF